MSISSDVTIIIPVHNRILFLPQILEYYRYFKDRIKPRIIVADSSSPENLNQNGDVIKKFNDVNVAHIPIQGTNRTLFHKIAEALDSVETEFCVCCADDDFITASGLEKAVEFLKNNKDFVAAHGNYISFYTKSSFSNNHEEFYWQPIYSDHSIKANLPSERLTDQFLNYKQTLYAVHRTGVLKNIYREIMANLDTEVKVLLFSELLSAMLVSIAGKIKDLDVFYSARREHATYQGQHIKWPLIRDYAKDGRLEGESVEFKECIVMSLLEAQPGLSQREAGIIVNEGFNASLKIGLPPDRFRHLVLNTSNFLKDKNAPPWTYNMLKKIYRTFVPVKRGGKAGDFSGTDLAQYNDDLQTLKDVVLNHTRRQKQ
ncbi:MAG: hypothetical protein A2655_01920 [Candidatus Yanofskybacteria bacterium RIFCSPHIGHO2_01_FULL_43_42]|uniref:Glycosyltransferase 2-like domain-containing protein n=1 Tax=Candidatus Yanofskybacteria bacterium RIFCSPLOWO2_01_FULL_43_22 TaxID=1802695 RepID=A0A1F8GH58_9BACT|nr:MAG: hypothetical protein A2655_01920 [Candidatus Yanofskybacteria bacterium RIFCSPHIGHO2_01_FULL_43_42]OGN13227.1 MAG: hypothetical protein A3D48_02825 [Candidatus Yanofskybacteria bacterium RIFCSPHIGHO2_02_FULL_43_17]OGN24643.1 MAG: hypothetical protein A3A13_01050 [Candidatus Yanofskybacteria bacterium RIFCSPLOWO2_01_FULL_43_22]